MKLGNLVQALPVMQKLAGEALTPKTLYWVNKMLDHAEKDLAFFNTERNKLIQKYGEEVEPEKWQVKSEHMPDFETGVQSLLDVAVEDNYTVVKIPTTENISLSYNDLQALKGFAELELIE